MKMRISFMKRMALPSCNEDFKICSTNKLVAFQMLEKVSFTTGFVAEDVKCLSVGRMAKRCDVSLNASPALGTLAEKLLNIELDKREDGPRHSE